MGKLLIILSFAFFLGIGYYSSSTNLGINHATENLSEYQHKVLARQVALTGLNRALYEVGAQPEWRGTLQGEYRDGQFNVRATSAGAERIRLVSDGSVAGIGHRIMADVVYGGNQDYLEAVVPEFMGYAFMSEDDMSLRGNIRIGNGGLHHPNADVHTNGSLSVSGRPPDIRGFGSYAKSGPRADLNNFKPNRKPEWAGGGGGNPNPGQKKEDDDDDSGNGGGNSGNAPGQNKPEPEPYNPNEPGAAPRVKQTDPVDLPEFKASEYAEKATRTTNGDLNLSGTYEGGTKEQPVIHYVKGNLTSTGGTMTGHVIFVVEGNIQFSGNMNNSSPSADFSNFAFYSTGNIKISGNATIHGQFYANGNISITGTPRVVGNVISRGMIDVGGNVHIDYRPASGILTHPIWPVVDDVDGQIRIVSYSET